MNLLANQGNSSRSGFGRRPPSPGNGKFHIKLIQKVFNDNFLVNCYLKSFILINANVSDIFFLRSKNSWI